MAALSEGEYLHVVQAMGSYELGDKFRDLFDAVEVFSGSEAAFLDGVTAGTPAASKCVVLDSGDDVTWVDGGDIALGTSTGTKIGTAAAQKLGFYNATPVVQRTKAGHNNWAALSDVVTALVELGLFDAA